MRVLVLSTYELGHQPVHAAAAAAVLRAAGHDARVRDLAVEAWDDGDVAWADALACSVPMHTARRLASEATGRARAVRPGLPVCWFGLYAVAATPARDGSVHLIAGEYGDALREWADDPAGQKARGAIVDIGRAGPTGTPVPDRTGLPGLDRYVRFVDHDGERTVAAVEASHGCAHRCRHCPVPVVYDGRTRAVATDTVLADIEEQVAAGARHVTFGDADFLNRPRHSLEIVREMRRHFEGAAGGPLTFDCTVKVEHILRHADVWDEMVAAGCRFVVSAFESVDDRTLALLDKGHTAAQAAEAVGLLRAHGIEIRPSFLPFLPWTQIEHLVDLLDFVADHDLVPNVDPVQYTIRLLLPPGSLLLDLPEVRKRVGAFDEAAHAWRWRPDDPALDDLQAELANIVESGAAEATGATPGATAGYQRVRDAVFAVAGRPDPRPAVDAAAVPPTRPRLTESWYCCSEPTDAQLSVLEVP